MAYWKSFSPEPGQDEFGRQLSPPELMRSRLVVTFIVLLTAVTAAITAPTATIATATTIAAPAAVVRAAAVAAPAAVVRAAAIAAPTVVAVVVIVVTATVTKPEDFSDPHDLPSLFRSHQEPVAKGNI